MKQKALQAPMEADVEEPTAEEPARRQRDLSQVFLSLIVTSMAILAALFSFEASPPVAAVGLIACSALIVVPIALRYVQQGRLVATPGLVLFGLVLLYTLPITVFTMTMDWTGFESLAPSSLMLTLGLGAIAATLVAYERPGPSADLANILEKKQRSIATASHVLMFGGLIWGFAVFGGPGGFYRYSFETTYWAKHVYFSGSAALGMFTMCFEVAGLLAALVLAIPSKKREVPFLIAALPAAFMVASVTNQGYRSPIILTAGVYLCARSAWPRSGARVLTLLALASVLVPVFLIWAYVRYHISGAGISDVAQLNRSATQSDWTNLRSSELGTMAWNGVNLFELIDSRRWSFQFGESLVFGPIYAMVPQAYWANRPDALQIVFTKAVAPEYLQGGTLSFSFVLEGYLNFWLFGAAAWSALLCRFLERITAWTTAAARNGRYFTVVLFFITDSLIWYYIRDDFGDLVRRWLITIIVTTIGLVIAEGIVATVFNDRRNESSEKPPRPMEDSPS